MFPCIICQLKNAYSDRIESIEREEKAFYAIISFRINIYIFCSFVMKSKGNNLRRIFLLFLIFTFLLGLYMYAFGHLSKLNLPHLFENMENKDSPSSSDKKEIPENCPDMLINKGDILLLYNSKKPEKEGENPLPFYNLDEYINYLEIQRNKGNVCPVLYLQKENDTQGKDVYRVRPSPFDQQGGLPPTQMITQTDPSNPIKILDATRDNPPYNKDNYNGFDPLGLHIGQYTEIDKIHDSTSHYRMSDNPMDPNWGGVLYTYQAVDSGKYEDREVTRPRYITPKGDKQFLNYPPRQG
jgi:hypothetical protein